MMRWALVLTVAAGLALDGGAQAQQGGARVSSPSSISAAPWFVPQAGTCREAPPPSERVQALRRAGDGAARALPYRPDGAAADSEPTRFTVRRGSGAEEAFFRTREDCATIAGGATRPPVAITAPARAAQAALTDMYGNPCPTDPDTGAFILSSPACSRAWREREDRRTAEISRRLNEGREAAAGAERERLEAAGISPSTHFQDGYGRWWLREEPQWFGPQGTVDCTLAPNPERYAEWFQNHLRDSGFGSGIPQGSTVSLGRLAVGEEPSGRDILARDVFIHLRRGEEAEDVPAHLLQVRLTITTSLRECRLAVRQNNAELEFERREWLRERALLRAGRPRTRP